MDRPRRGAWITASAVFKFVKAAALIGASVGMFRLLNARRLEHAREWIIGLALQYRPSSLPKVRHAVDAVGHGRVELVGIIALAYAALFLVEGTGLWLAKRWAEYFTIVATSSLLPLEIYELTRRTTAPRVVALVVNLLVVAYLVWHVRKRERAT